MTYKILRKFKLTPDQEKAYKGQVPFSMIEPMRVTSYLLPSPPNQAWKIEYMKNGGTYFVMKPFYKTDDFRRDTEKRIRIKQGFLRNFAEWVIDVTKATRLVVDKRWLKVPKEPHLMAILEEVPNEMGPFAGTYLTIIRNCRQRDNATLERLLETAKMFGMKDNIPLNVSFTALRIAHAKGQLLEMGEGEKIDLTPGPKVDISKSAKIEDIDDLSDLFDETIDKTDEPPTTTV